MTEHRLPDDAYLDRLALRVRDLDPSLRYYVDLLGLVEIEREGDRTTLAPAGERFHLDLIHVPDAPARPYPWPGL